MVLDGAPSWYSGWLLDGHAQASDVATSSAQVGHWDP